MEPPNTKEIEALKSFRNRINDLKLEGNQKCDLYLLSWLRARDLDLNKSEDMLRKSFEWRRINDIDNILNWKCPDTIDKEFPYQISGFDKSGSPVCVLPYGRWDLRKLVELGLRNDYIKYNNQIYSKLISQVQKSQDSFTQFVSIIDMEGYSFRQLTSAGCVDATLEVARTFEANYPERLKTAYVVNAPKIFSILFALIKPLLSPRTLAKIQIFSSNSSKWKTVLLNNIPADQLPIKYGGTNAMASNMQNIIINTTDNETDGLVEVTVGAGGKLEAQYDVKHGNTTLSWKFKTDNFDICFALRHGDKNIIENERVDSHVAEQSGTFLCDKPGTYVLVFDNTYSVVREKTLRYLVTMSCPDDSDEDENTNF